MAQPINVEVEVLESNMARRVQINKRQGDDNNCLDIEELKRKLEETESAMTNIIARMSQIVPKSQVSVPYVLSLSFVKTPISLLTF